MFVLVRPDDPTPRSDTSDFPNRDRSNAESRIVSSSGCYYYMWHPDRKKTWEDVRSLVTLLMPWELAREHNTSRPTIERCVRVLGENLKGR